MVERGQGEGLTGQRLGPYELLDRLGEGGMGVVYRAEQSEPVRRFVAVKVLRGGIDTRKVETRFAAERQALAVMDHPSIAKVLDAGNTPDGRPFFVMELVDGVPLTSFADVRRLSIRQRVELFTRVCRGVQHAHSKGVIHRDLKPSNILVSEVDGGSLPRIIDFGIAKAVAPDVEEWARLTQAEDTLGTPAYMSPEQLEASMDVDVRSDIYSLGIVLYELLVGALPFEASKYRAWSAFVAQKEDAAPRLGLRFDSLETQETVAAARGVDPRTLRRELRGDLEWIVSRAMRADREERYETANGFAMDLDRYLSGHPVVAGPPGAAYRVRKFVRRHVASVAFTAASVVALGAFGVWQAVQAERIREARDLADARREQAEGVLDFMLTDLREKLEPLGRLDIMEGVGQQAMSYFATLPTESFSEGELLSRSQALYQLGSVRLDQGDLPAADSAFQESLRLAADLSARDPGNPDWLFGLSQAEFWAGEAARRRGDLEDSFRHFESYLARSEELSARDTTNLTWLLEVGYGHTNVGAIHLLRGDLARSAEHLTRSLEVKEVVAAASPDNVGRQYDLARGYYNLARVQEDLGRLSEAAVSYREDIRIKQAILEVQPTNATVLTTLADSENGLGQLLTIIGAPDEAYGMLERSYRRISDLVARDPANVRWLASRGVALQSVAEQDLRRGDPERAAARLGEAIRILESAVEIDPDRPATARQLALAHAALGRVLVAAGAADEALVHLRTGLADFVDADLRDDPVALGRAAGVSIGLGRALAAAGDPDGAREAWSGALADLEALAARTPDPHHGVLAGLAEALVLLGRSGEAAPHLERLRIMGYSEAALARLRSGSQ